MITSSISLYASASNRNNQHNTNSPKESFSEQIISLNKAIRTEYIKLSEQQLGSARPNPAPTKQKPKANKKGANHK